MQPREVAQQPQLRLLHALVGGGGVGVLVAGQLGQQRGAGQRQAAPQGGLLAQGLQVAAAVGELPGVVGRQLALPGGQLGVEVGVGG